MVRVIPAGGTSKLLTIPIDGTLIRAQQARTTFLVDSQQLRSVTDAVMEARCLSSRHARDVPDTQLSALPMGPALGLPPP
jgi:hypothetical protein